MNTEELSALTLQAKNDAESATVITELIQETATMVNEALQKKNATLSETQVVNYIALVEKGAVAKNNTIRSAKMAVDQSKPDDRKGNGYGRKYSVKLENLVNVWVADAKKYKEMLEKDLDDICAFPAVQSLLVGSSTMKKIDEAKKAGFRIESAVIQPQVQAQQPQAQAQIQQQAKKLEAQYAQAQVQAQQAQQQAKNLEAQYAQAQVQAQQAQQQEKNLEAQYVQAQVQAQQAQWQAKNLEAQYAQAQAQLIQLKQAEQQQVKDLEARGVQPPAQAQQPQTQQVQLTQIQQVQLAQTQQVQLTQAQQVQLAQTQQVQLAQTQIRQILTQLTQVQGQQPAQYDSRLKPPVSPIVINSDDETQDVADKHTSSLIGSANAAATGQQQPHYIPTTMDSNNAENIPRRPFSPSIFLNPAAATITGEQPSQTLGQSLPDPSSFIGSANAATTGQQQPHYIPTTMDSNNAENIPRRPFSPSIFLNPVAATITGEQPSQTLGQSLPDLLQSFVTPQVTNLRLPGQTTATGVAGQQQLRRSGQQIQDGPPPAKLPRRQ